MTLLTESFSRVPASALRPEAELLLCCAWSSTDSERAARTRALLRPDVAGIRAVLQATLDVLQAFFGTESVQLTPYRLSSQKCRYERAMPAVSPPLQLPD
jgi:hypothetical protein